MTARARLAATSRILGVSFACLVLIAARAVGATGERTVSGVRISLGEEGRRWTLIPTMLEGKVESFVALREEIPFGENLTAVWYRKSTSADGAESWESLAFAEQDQSKAIRAVKDALTLSDATDGSWPVAVAPVEAPQPEAMVKGVLETDALAPMVTALENPQPFVEMLEGAGWKAAWIAPLEGGAPPYASSVNSGENGCPRGEVLAALALSVESVWTSTAFASAALHASLGDCTTSVCVHWTIGSASSPITGVGVRFIQSIDDLRDAWIVLAGSAITSDEFGIRLLDDGTIVGYGRGADGVETYVLGTFETIEVLESTATTILENAELPTLTEDRLSLRVIGLFHTNLNETVYVHATLSRSTVSTGDAGPVVDSITAICPHIISSSYTGLMEAVAQLDSPPGGLGGSGSGGAVGASVKWCRDERGFCNAAVACAQRYEEDKLIASLYRVACLTSVNQLYTTCMGNCLTPTGAVVTSSWCAGRHLVCAAPAALAAKLCDVTFLSLTLEADLAFGRCISDAKRQFSRLLSFRESQAGCGCPLGFVPFPQQQPPRWGDIDCAPEFTIPGAPGWPYPLWQISLRPTAP